MLLILAIHRPIKIGRFLAYVISKEFQIVSTLFLMSIQC